ncbi:expressed unknown protein [Seminavis robusta]|uniref:Uncharacterized protein n=1 Tax=Seminavis robusta TaxID=568900 RepID=A0A9N8H632_9STRA|nr:expressed unknown protein [Seminavis robusta]|eukprot:Sro101_g051820.1 n/a (601) ;mRNA; r:115135-116937
MKEQHPDDGTEGDDSEAAEEGQVVRSHPTEVPQRVHYRCAVLQRFVPRGRVAMIVSGSVLLLSLGVLILLIVRGNSSSEDGSAMISATTSTTTNTQILSQDETTTTSSTTNSRSDNTQMPTTVQETQRPMTILWEIGDFSAISRQDPTLVPFPLEASQCRLADGEYFTDLFEEPFESPSIDLITPSWLDYTTIGSPFNRTFDVVANHTVLENGVIFNVETVPQVLPEHLQSPRLSESDILEAVLTEAGKFYREPTYPIPLSPEVHVEIMSRLDPDKTVFAGGQGFLAAGMLAFAQHLPLALSPDHLWAVIASGFAYHVDQYAEELRHHFVNHTGQAEIHIQEDTMLRRQSPPEQWEALIFPKFAEEIRANMNNTLVYDLMVEQTFTTTTPTSHAASRITLMAALKAYFSYSMTTACGIPQIKLEGRRKDWVALRTRTQHLSEFMLVNHPQGDLWINDVVVPILDQFIDAYDGNVNYCFWQNMVKFRNSADGSGAYDFLSGWLPNLFPYLTFGNGEIRENRYLRHWSLSAMGDQKGPDPSHIPIQMSSAPVLWNYLEDEFHLHFHAGFRGVEQLDEDEDVSSTGGMLRPVLGWYITYDPVV